MEFYACEFTCRIILWGIIIIEKIFLGKVACKVSVLMHPDQSCVNLYQSHLWVADCSWHQFLALPHVFWVIWLKSLHLPVPLLPSLWNTRNSKEFSFVKCFINLLYKRTVFDPCFSRPAQSVCVCSPLGIPHPSHLQWDISHPSSPAACICTVLLQAPMSVGLPPGDQRQCRPQHVICHWAISLQPRRTQHLCRLLGESCRQPAQPPQCS